MTLGYFQRNALVAGFLATVAAITAALWIYGMRAALDQLEQKGRSDLALASDRLVGQLQRYREMAVLGAGHPVVADLAGGRTGARARARDVFLDMADKTGAREVLFVDVEGIVQASARGATGRLAGYDFIDRAMQGALGRGHGVDAPLPGRAFYFAAPAVDARSRVRGALVVAADIPQIENAWRGGAQTVFFSDASGRLFVTNRSDLEGWVGLAAGGLAPQSGNAPNFHRRSVAGHDIWRLGLGPYLPRESLHLTQPLPVIGLTGEMLLDLAPVRRLARAQAAAVAALCLAFGALLFLATERRRTLALANAQLEGRVARRTQALEDANTQLRREATEREAAQAALARAQADLVQAGKLSALGQLSAGLSHELNQPLMAIGSFAENGQRFLERGQPARAEDNLRRIIDMTRRMGRIIKNLRAFSRQETEPSGRVDAQPALDQALELAAPKLRDAGVRVAVDRPDGPVWVRAGEVRLSQVFVNLIGNAADAMAGRHRRHLTIEVRQGARTTFAFHDTGGGIDAPEQVFDPFYTTKPVGSSDGMGLGLSISYGIVQSFGGEIRGQNHDTGACFTVTLDRLDPPLPANPPVTPSREDAA